jgi:hypothetical protein
MIAFSGMLTAMAVSKRAGSAVHPMRYLMPCHGPRDNPQSNAIATQVASRELFQMLRVPADPIFTGNRSQSMV